jgi:RNA polymerase sigma-70 factor (ECF subfamily)
MSISEFDHLVLKNSDSLRPFAINLTRNSEQAKDLYQETLCKAIANRDKYTTSTNIKAWLYTIMRNIFINDYRRMVNRKTISQDPTADYQYFNTPALICNNAESHIVLKEIQKKINSLPEIFQQPFTLYFEGYRYQEIADALNEPLGTIKSRIHFARKLLKEQVKRN